MRELCAMCNVGRLLEGCASRSGENLSMRTQMSKRKIKCECEQQVDRIKLLEPKNQLQHAYMQCIKESPIIIATGYPGTGKTYIPARIAAQMLKQGYISNITLTRPNVSSSKSMGHYPGSKNEKMQHWLSPVLGALKEEFPLRTINLMASPEMNKIIMCPLELVKGLSWNDTFMIADEAEDMTIEIGRAHV